MQTCNLMYHLSQSVTIWRWWREEDRNTDSKPETKLEIYLKTETKNASEPENHILNSETTEKNNVKTDKPPITTTQQL